MSRIRKNPCLPCMLAVANPAQKPSRLPDPGTLTELGHLQEYRIERDADGEEEIHRFGGDTRLGPKVYWSTKLRMLLTFPHVRARKYRDYPDGMSAAEARRYFQDIELDPKAVKLFRKWSIHEPTGVEKLKLSDYLLRPYGRVVHGLYASDKFNPRREMERFIHPHPKAGKHEDRIAFGVGNPPKVLAVWGPKLTVTERGIVN